MDSCFTLYMTTIQAQRVIDALKEIGLKHGSWKKGGDFTVRTEITRRKDKAASGRTYTYSEFGDAMAHTSNSAANLVIAENAQALADKGLHVIVLRYTSGRVISVVSSKYNPNHIVDERFVSSKENS